MRKWKLAFVIALFYVSTGTAYGLYYHDISDLPLFIFYFFAPVSLLPAILSSGESTNYGLLVIVQVISLLITCLLLWLTLWIGSKLVKRLRVAPINNANP